MSEQKWTKAEIIDAVYTKTGFNKADIKTVYSIIFSEIKSALAAGKKIELRGMGTFELKTLCTRKKARNPRTGETVELSPRRTVRFKPGQELKDAVRSLPCKDGFSCQEDCQGELGAEA